MPFPAPVAEAIARIIPTCITNTLQKPKAPKKRVLLLALDNSGSEGNFMNGSTIYEHEQTRAKEYALNRLNSGVVNEVYLSSWNTVSSSFIQLTPTRHLITKTVTGFSNWNLPQPTGGTVPCNAFDKAYELIKSLESGCEYEYFIATDGTDFDGQTSGFQQTQLIESCKKLMSLKNVSMTVVGIIPNQVNYANITESQPIPGLTLANLLFQYVSKCMMCSGNEMGLTTVFQKQEQTSSAGILFCNEFRLPHGINIIAFLSELVKQVKLHTECMIMEKYDILLDGVVSLCVLQLKGIINPLAKKVQWFEQVKSAMITIGTTVYCKADPTLTQQQVKNAVTDKFTENFTQVSQGSARMCSGAFIQGKRNLFQEVSTQLKASGTLSYGVDNVLFIVHDHATGFYKFVRVSDPSIRNQLCTVQGIPFSGFNNSSLALPDITDPAVLGQQGQVIRQAVRSSASILLPKFVGDLKDSVFIFMWGVEWVKGMLSGLPQDCDHMDILKLLFCTMADKKVMGKDGKESTLLQEWKKGNFPERLDDGKSLPQIVSSSFLDIKGIEPRDMEGLLFVALGKNVFESFVKQEQICTLRIRMGLPHTPSYDEFLAYAIEKYAHLKCAISIPISHDVPFYSHAPYSPFQQDYIDLQECGQLWSVLPHSVNGRSHVCDVRHQDGGFYCTDLERINMMGDNGGRCLYCRQPLMPCHFEKKEGGWPTLQTFLGSQIPIGPHPQIPSQGTMVTSTYVALQTQAGGGAAQHRPQISSAITTGSGQQVPEMPHGMSNNRKKTWNKYVMLYNKRCEQQFLDVLNKIVEEETKPASVTSP
jgi:hypothetical protein